MGGKGQDRAGNPPTEALGWAAPDGSRIAFLAKDDAGIVQVFQVAPAGGPIAQPTRFEAAVDTPFDWSPDSRWLACSAGGRIRLIDAGTGQARCLTAPSPEGQQPLHGVVFSPDGKQLAFNRRLPHRDGGEFLQVCLVEAVAE
jgi:WD40 repeat protein